MAGTYNIVEEFSIDSKPTHGIAIQDNLYNKIWVLNRNINRNYQYDMVTGMKTGVKWNVGAFVDGSDQAFCEYPGMPNQTIFAHFYEPCVVIFEEQETGKPDYKCSIPLLDDWSGSYSVAAGAGYLYVYDLPGFAWAPYTGAEVSWELSSNMHVDYVAGMAVWPTKTTSRYFL